MLSNKIMTSFGSKPEGMPAEWEYFRELANENESAFLITSGGIDTIAFLGAEEFIMKIYGGADGKQLLYTLESGSGKKIDLWKSDIANHPLPTGLLFSRLNGKPYSDSILGDVELFTVVTSRTDGNPVCIAVSDTEYCKINFPSYRVLACDLNIPSSPAIGGCLKNTLDLKYVFFKSGMSVIPAYAFQNSALKKCDIPDNITYLNTAAFYGTAIEEIYIPDTVTFLGEYLFADCTYLKDVHLPQSSTTINAAMFTDCTSLSKLEIPQTYKKIADTAFYGCKNLKEINLHSTLTDLHPSQLFSNCEVLDKLEYYGTVAKAREGTDMLTNCHQLRYIDMPNLKLKSFDCKGKNANARNKIGSAEIGNREPIVIDWVNFDTSGSSVNVWNTSYTCLTQEQYLTMFNRLYENGKVFNDKNFIITGSVGATDTVRDFITDKLGGICVG